MAMSSHSCSSNVPLIPRTGGRGRRGRGRHGRVPTTAASARHGTWPVTGARSARPFYEVRPFRKRAYRRRTLRERGAVDKHDAVQALGPPLVARNGEVRHRDRIRVHLRHLVRDGHAAHLHNASPTARGAPRRGESAARCPPSLAGRTRAPGAPDRPPGQPASCPGYSNSTQQTRDPLGGHRHGASTPTLAWHSVR